MIESQRKQILSIPTGAHSSVAWSTGVQLLQISSVVLWQTRDLHLLRNTLYLLSPRLCFFIVLKRDYTPNGYSVPAKFGTHFLPCMKNDQKRIKMHLNEVGFTSTEFCKI